MPGAPGRVVTVVAPDVAQDKDDFETREVAGICYKISPQHRQAVLEYLDIREQG